MERSTVDRDARLLLGALFLAALALRPQLVGIGPLLSSIRQTSACRTRRPGCCPR